MEYRKIFDELKLSYQNGQLFTIEEEHGISLINKKINSMNNGNFFYLDKGTYAFFNLIKNNFTFDEIKSALESKGLTEEEINQILEKNLKWLNFDFE